MIDRKKRNELIDMILKLKLNHITWDEYDSWYFSADLRSQDAAIKNIHDEVYTFFDPEFPSNYPDDDVIGRMCLFLLSDQEYTYPPDSFKDFLMGIIYGFLSLLCIRRKKILILHWPFASQDDYQNAIPQYKDIYLALREKLQKSENAI
jgi:hypothetical protein